MIEVEVWVRVERQRNPVSGLRPEDFEVASEGQSLPIVAFEELDLRRVRAEPTVPEPPSRPEAEPSRPARHFLVVLDLGRTSSHFLQSAVAGVREMVERSLHPDDRLALALWGTRDANLLHGFTTDRTVIEAGLDVVDAVFARSPRRQRAALDALRSVLPEGDRADLARQIGLGGAMLAVDATELRSLFTGPTTGVTAEWGSLESNGVLQSADGSTLRLPAPFQAAGNTLTGEGWKAVLSPGWGVRGGDRAGDFRVVPYPD